MSGRLLTALIAATMIFAADAYSCTTAVISAKASGTGRPMLWKQRDTSGEVNYLDFFDCGKYSFTGIVASTDTLRESVWGGANNVGFAIMNSQSYGLSPLKDVDRPYEGMIMKEALASCATVDEFEKYMASLPQPNGLEANFGVIDAFGGAAYFEVHDFGYRRFDAGDGYLVRSNWSVTGRPGEGHGYDRSAMAEESFSAHVGMFVPTWFWSEMATRRPICRKTSVSSLVIEGVGDGDRADSAVLWVDPGFPGCSYPIAAWVAACNEIPSVLRSDRDGFHYSPLNELAEEMKSFYFDPAESERAAMILSEASRNASEEYSEGTVIDSKLRLDSCFLREVRKYNEAADARYEAFRRKITGR